MDEIRAAINASMAELPPPPLPLPAAEEERIAFELSCCDPEQDCCLECCDAPDCDCYGGF